MERAGERSELGLAARAYVEKARKKYAKEPSDVNVRRPPRLLAPSLGRGRRAERDGVGCAYIGKAGKKYAKEPSDVNVRARHAF